MTLEAVIVAKRWMRLALPDDFAQLLEIAKYLHKTEHRQAVWLEWQLKLLRHNVWDRRIGKRPRKPTILRPSREARVSGYRRSADMHQRAYRNRRAD